jgi:hypothetical protein
MNPDIKEQWTKALRSGDYNQGQCYLFSTDNYQNERFCCLGVLADVCKVGKQADTLFSKEGFTFASGLCNDRLPITFLDEVGLTEVDQDILATKNDHGV